MLDMVELFALDEFALFKEIDRMFNPSLMNGLDIFIYLGSA